MYDQGKITKDEYDAAMKESANMTFVGYTSDRDDEDDNDDGYIQNWYIDELFYDAQRTLHNTTTSVRTLRPISFTQRVLKSTALWI